MKFSMKITVAATIFLTGVAASYAQQPMRLDEVGKPDDKGVMFTNGLSEPITEGYAMPQEQCEVYLCDKWERIDNPDRVLEPSKSAVMTGIFVNTGGKPRICNWALKVVTPSATHEFPAMDICVPKVRSQIAFRTDEDGKIIAVKAYKDEEDKLQTVATEALGQ